MFRAVLGPSCGAGSMNLRNSRLAEFSHHWGSRRSFSQRVLSTGCFIHAAGGAGGGERTASRVHLSCSLGLCSWEGCRRTLTGIFWKFSGTQFGPSEVPGRTSFVLHCTPAVPCMVFQVFYEQSGRVLSVYRTLGSVISAKVIVSIWFSFLRENWQMLVTFVIFI